MCSFNNFYAASNAWNADYCDRWSRRAGVCLTEPNGWTDRGSVWGTDSCGPCEKHKIMIPIFFTNSRRHSPNYFGHFLLDTRKNATISILKRFVIAAARMWPIRWAADPRQCRPTSNRTKSLQHRTTSIFATSYRIGIKSCNSHHSTHAMPNH